MSNKHLKLEMHFIFPSSEAQTSAHPPLLLQDKERLNLARISNFCTRRNSRIAEPEPQLGPHHCSAPSLQSTVLRGEDGQQAPSSVHPVLAPTLSKAMSRREGPSAGTLFCRCRSWSLIFQALNRDVQ
ncbi:hypothetical protein KC19_9G062300 [Ceratodon purpureus]|uniref:Uncharacterized protein n=1 Tax=Ceratodon purpureus TaxID=3225 RepID=A0A8T0GTB4_CERPU|nr:hypothetical protein KC19_9G062300 [Ceratodon purpureus]